MPNILFHGPPGTGKTFTAEALATELGLPFTKLSGSDITSKWINESSQRIATLVEEAKIVADTEGGAVVYPDELDTLLKARSGAWRSHEEDNKVTNEFPNHLQDTGERDILVIGATNRMDSLDDAVFRSGRIDKTVYIGKPDREARQEILRAKLTDRGNSLTDKHIEYVARATERMVAFSDQICELLDDWLATKRPSVTDEFGREPLLASRQGPTYKTTFGAYVTGGHDRASPRMNARTTVMWKSVKP